MAGSNSGLIIFEWVKGRLSVLAKETSSTKSSCVPVVDVCRALRSLFALCQAFPTCSDLIHDVISQGSAFRNTMVYCGAVMYAAV